MAAELSAQGLRANDEQLKTADFDKYYSPASEESIKKTQEALEKAGHKVYVADDAAQALEILKQMVPKGASISNGHSVTLKEIGWESHIKESKDYRNFKGEAVAKMMSGDMAGYGEALAQGYAADYFMASATAVTETGEILTADLTGSRIGGIYSAKNAVFVVGTQKIVADGEAAERRLSEFGLPLTSAEARLVYKVPASAIANKVHIKSGNPFSPGRIHVVLVKGTFGY